MAGGKYEGAAVGYTMAIDFVVSVLVFAALGWGLGAWLGGMQWWVIGGVVVGFGAGVYRLLKQSMKLTPKSKTTPPAISDEEWERFDEDGREEAGTGPNDRPGERTRDRGGMPPPVP